jgi:hypothetical protein
VSQCERSSSRLVRQMCPNPPDGIRIAPDHGHEIKLGGDTGEGCGRAIRPRSPRHGRCYGETELSNPRHPISIGTPTMARRCGSKAGVLLVFSSLPRNRMRNYGRAGASAALHPHWLVPSVVRHVKGSKGHLRQHKTCDTSNAGTGSSSSNGRSADDQCWHRGREAVVVGGVTTTQGYG